MSPASTFATLLLLASPLAPPAEPAVPCAPPLACPAPAPHFGDSAAATPFARFLGTSTDPFDAASRAVAAHALPAIADGPVQSRSVPEPSAAELLAGAALALLAASRWRAGARHGDEG